MILDILYLFPQYNSVEPILNLRLDEDFMKEDFDWKIFDSYLKVFNSKALAKRANFLLELYK